MNKLNIFLFCHLITNIYLLPDYCSSKINPKEPNDCVFLSTSTTKCCFKKNYSRCLNESYADDSDGLICDIDYFYNYSIGDNNYSYYKDKIGYCTFIFGNIKGAFEYDIVIDNTLNINEFNGLIINCLSNQQTIQINLIVFTFIIFLIF